MVRSTPGLRYQGETVPDRVSDEGIRGGGIRLPVTQGLCLSPAENEGEGEEQGRKDGQNTSSRQSM